MDGASDDDEDDEKMTNGDTSRDLMNYDDDVNDPVNVRHLTKYLYFLANNKYFFLHQGQFGKY